MRFTVGGVVALAHMHAKPHLGVDFALNLEGPALGKSDCDLFPGRLFARVETEIRRFDVNVVEDIVVVVHSNGVAETDGDVARREYPAFL
jgi:hypothetical protein